MAAKSAPKDPFDIDAGVPVVEGEVRPKPRFADRISKRVLFGLYGLVAVVIFIWFWALDAMDRGKDAHRGDAPKPAAEAKKATETVVPKDLTDVPGDSGPGGRAPASLVVAAPSQRDAAPVLPRSGIKEAGAAPVVPALQGGRGSAQELAVLDDELGAGDARLDGQTKPVKVLTPEEQAVQQAKLDRLKRMQQARQGGLVAVAYGVDQRAVAGGSGLPAGASTLLASLAGQAGAMAPPAGASLVGGQRVPEADQDEKLQFLKNASKDDANYLRHTPTPALSPNEVKRGSYIPLRLETAINSDQPGMINARVTEDVYDTTTGCRLLIPAMTLVQGLYDSKVVLGQTRNLAVWNYMRFEDGSDLNLAGMQGYDSSGAAGIAADVDNHYFKLFGLAFGMSLVTAGVQQSITPPPANTNGMSTQQSISTALAQQYGQLGAQIITKQMQVQPTLRNYPGERFVIMTPLTIILKKVWRQRC